MTLAFRLLAPLCLVFCSACTTLIDITTSEPLQIDPGKRTAGARMDDSQIETIAAVNLRKVHAGILNGNVHVNSFNGVVLLTGQVANEELRSIAGNTVNKINNVRQVHNELQVGPNATFTDINYDTWLTTKVKGKLLARGDIEGRRVRVITENGTVFLMGLATREEADRITGVASNTRGVRKIVRVFEYID